MTKVVYKQPASLKEKNIQKILACWPGTKGRLTLAMMLRNGNNPTKSYELYTYMYAFNKKLRDNPIKGKTYRLVREKYVYQLWEVKY